MEDSLTVDVDRAGPPDAEPEKQSASSGGTAKPSTKSSVRLGVTLTRAQRAWVKEEAASRGVPQSGVVKELVDRAIAALPLEVPAAAASSGAAAPPAAPLGVPAVVSGDKVAAAPVGTAAASPAVHASGPARPSIDLPPGVQRTGVAGAGSAAAAVQPAPVGAAPAGVPVGAELVDPRTQHVFPIEDAVPGIAGGGDGSAVMLLRRAGDGGAAAVFRAPAAASASFAALLSAAPAFVRYGIGVFVILVVFLGFLYLGSTVLSSRYRFEQVVVAPGRSVFFKVDTWTGRMTRCRTDSGAVGLVC